MIGKGTIAGIGGVVITLVGASEKAPQLVSASMTHNHDIIKVKNSAQAYVSLIDNGGECLQLDIEYAPYGEGATPLADAKTSMKLPALLASMTITGFPIVAVGSFTDAFNTNGGNTQPWIYEGGGKIVPSSGDKWVGQATFYRYPSITSATALSA